MTDLTLDDARHLLQRRRAVFIAVAGAVFAATVIFTASWSRYRTSAMIEIEQPLIQPSIATIGAANTGAAPAILADRRIRAVEQKVTANDSLIPIIKELNLYANSGNQSPEQLAERMRSRIKLEFVTSPVSNPAATQKESVDQLSATGFMLRFEYDDAETAKRALDALVARFLAEDAEWRKTQSEETVRFIDEELSALETSIQSQEEQVASFRATYGEAGPLALSLREQSSMSNRMNLQQVESALSANEASLGALRGQLAGADPYLPLVENGEVMHTPVSQLKNLKTQLASLTGRYGPDHPDVQKLKGQIAALKKSGASEKPSVRDADNPVYLQLSAQLAAAEAQNKTLRAQRDNLMKQQTQFARDIAQNPKREQELSKLTLDLDNAKERYRALKDKKLAASMRLKIEASESGSQLRVKSAGYVPGHTSPARVVIFLAGTMLAFLSGLFAILMLEWIRPTIRSARHLATLVGSAPLITLPHMRGNV